MLDRQHRKADVKVALHTRCTGSSVVFGRVKDEINLRVRGAELLQQFPVNIGIARWVERRAHSPWTRFLRVRSNWALTSEISAKNPRGGGEHVLPGGGRVDLRPGAYQRCSPNSSSNARIW